MCDVDERRVLRTNGKWREIMTTLGKKIVDSPYLIKEPLFPWPVLLTFCLSGLDPLKRQSQNEDIHYLHINRGVLAGDF